MRLAQAGVTAGVLVYRLPEDGWAGGIDAPLRGRAAGDGGAAQPGRPSMRMHAGVLGFSAGGNLAARLAPGSEETRPVLPA